MPIKHGGKFATTSTSAERATFGRTNIGDEPMRLYAIYGPPDHEPGTVHDTQEDAENDPHEH